MKRAKIFRISSLKRMFTKKIQVKENELYTHINTHTQSLLPWNSFFRKKIIGKIFVSFVLKKCKMYT